MKTITNYLRFIKIEHTIFSVPVVFAGTLLAKKMDPQMAFTSFQIVWILLAMTSGRAAGFALNRIVDRNIDAKNPRTKNREIPSGKISLRSAWIFTSIAIAIFVASAWQIAPICGILSPIPIILFWGYPFLKRFTPWTHIGLGIAWGTGPLGGWLAATQTIAWSPSLIAALLLFSFSVLWVAGFDVLYALLDEDFDAANGIHSIPSHFGKDAALRISEIFHAVAIVLLVLLILNFSTGVMAWLVGGSILLTFILSHWAAITRPITPEVINFAFFKMNGIAAFLLLILFAI